MTGERTEADASLATVAPTRTVLITHTTRYLYRTAVSLGPHRLMLRPRETRDHRLVSFDLAITPEARIDWAQDVAGNAVATASFDTMTDRLAIRARMAVALRAPDRPVLAVAADAVSFPFRYGADDRIDLGALATPQYADHAGRLPLWVEGFVMGRPTDTLSLLTDISTGVAARISYQSRETEGTQGPLETLDRGWGSCRDLAVLFAEAVRTLGFGARLVSGYLHDPSDDRVGSARAGTTHAWVEVFVPGAGWIPFDPTNGSVGSRDLVPVAVGRTIRQVAPVTGSFHGTSADAGVMEVTVDVAEA